MAGPILCAVSTTNNNNKQSSRANVYSKGECEPQFPPLMVHTLGLTLVVDWAESG